MSHREWTRFASGASSRALKYRHLLDEALGLSDPELVVLAVLMLRGAQTPASSSSAPSACTGSARPRRWVQTLEGLAQRELVRRLERRPGQKEERYEQLLGGGTTQELGSGPSGQTPDFEARLSRLEAAVEDLRARLDA
jgi:uncharacterized protein YceH (UPF0502 family)